MAKLMNKVRNYGSDPEFAIADLYDTKEDTLVKIIPPMALVQDFGFEFVGKTDQGKNILYESLYGKVIEDGAAAEIIVKPSTSPATLLTRITQIKREFNNVLLELSRTHGYNNKLKTVSDVTVFFDTKKYWKDRDDSFRDCVRFGCDADFHPKVLNELGLTEEHEEQNVEEYPYRHLGGHAHIQNMSEYPDIYERNKEFVGIVFDFVVGLRNVCLDRYDAEIEHEKIRLKSYGHPGRGRLQQYSDTVNGYEYRPPSSFWINNRRYDLLYDAGLAGDIVEAQKSEEFFDDFYALIPDMWEASVNFNKDIASKLHKEVMRWVVENLYRDDNKSFMEVVQGFRN
jgi:hypothetical protein